MRNYSVAARFAALGDPTRLSLLTTLSHGRERSIASLSVGTELTRQAITKHLHVLEKAGLVRNSRIGRESHCAFRPEQIVEMQAYLETVSRQWDAALERLRSFVEC
ncbi:ArsR family transcriptional regulator [Rhizobium sp. Root1220]|nr:ArsR family transcriptional regulator [Rhizobium sp. Root1220]